VAEVLHQQKVDLVAGRIIFGRLGEEMLQQGEHALLIHQCAGLKELAQLIDLNGLVHLGQPRDGALDAFTVRRLRP